MENEVLNAERAIFFDALLKKTQGEGCDAPIGMGQVLWVELIAGGFVEKIEE